MITLNIPKVDSGRYCVANGWLCGPFGSSGQLEEESIPTESSLRFLQQYRGIYGENGVLHVDVNGSVSYNKALNSMELSPPTTYPLYPNRIKYYYKTVLGTGSDYANYGLGVSGASSKCEPTASTWLQVAFSGTFPYCTTCALSGLKSVPTKPNAGSKYTMHGIQSIDDSYIYVYMTTYSAGFIPAQEVADWSSWQSAETIIHGFDAQPLRSTTESILKVRWRELSSEGLVSTSMVLRELELEAVHILNAMGYCGGVDFGDLAIKATEGFNANSVNMIAFLRDLRHPQDMILKLRNLRSLKTLAGNYLAVKYGILPTVDDIKSIVEACHHVKPYFDRNGFRTSTASHTTSNVIDGRAFSNTQRLKLAVAKEDSGLDYIIESLDSIGVFPTFQNIWDLLPYSFVVDWLLDVGDLLERVDTRLRLERFNVRYATMSTKCTGRGDFIPRPSFPYSGYVEVVRYHRWVTDHCPVPTLSPNPTFQVPNHWLEAGALLIQRSKLK